MPILKDLFKPKEPAPQASVTIKGTTQSGNVVVSSNVEWQKEGVSDAGSAHGDVNAFRAGFGSCFSRVKKSQELDMDLQNQMKSQLMQEKSSLESELEGTKSKRNNAQERVQESKSAVDSIKQEISRVKDGDRRGNKSLLLNLYLGVAIVVLLTIYLFIFYSSTAYSAFFRNFDGSVNLTESMFDGQAVVKSFRKGFVTGCFVLFMPVIFLALGYVAHGFSTTSKGFERYVKTVLIYLITFLFDCLLAYKISNSFYNIEVIFSRTPMPPYSMKMAFANTDFWIVIFCGFVAYLIWGLVFSFAMSCYDRLTDNTYILKDLEDKLASEQTLLNQLQAELAQLDQKIAQLEGDIKNKEHEINNFVRYDYGQIKQSLADYYKGWTGYFALVSYDTTSLTKVYEEELQKVNNWIDNKTTNHEEK